MAITLHIDRLTNLSAIEQRGGDFDLGVLVELRREVLVSGLNLDPESGGTPDFRVLKQALDAMPGGLAFGDSPIDHPDLILVERMPRLIPGEQTKVMVELVYKRYKTSLETMGFMPGVGEFIPRGGGALRQTTTARDQFGNDITVQHTYPASDTEPGYPYWDTQLAGKTKHQTGEVQVDLPSDTLEFEGRMMTMTPGAVSRTWRGTTNEFPWNAGEIGTWRCSEVSFVPWDIADPEFPSWVFNFLFQYDPTGWNPDVMFREPHDGKPAVPLVQGVSIKEVDWYPLLDFGTWFPS